MALLKRTETSIGIVLEQAYIKIGYTGGDSLEQCATVSIYVDAETRASGKEPVQLRNYNFPCSVTDDAPNFIKQGYEYLKTLPEFADAIDA